MAQLVLNIGTLSTTCEASLGSLAKIHSKQNKTKQSKLFSCHYVNSKNMNEHKENFFASLFFRCKTSSFFNVWEDILSTNDNLHTHLWRSSIIIHFCLLTIVLWLCTHSMLWFTLARGTASFRPSSFNIWYWKCVGFLLLCRSVIDFWTYQLGPGIGFFF